MEQKIFYEINELYKKINNKKTITLIKKDLQNFLIYMANIDNKITFHETEVMAYYLDLKTITPNKAKNIALTLDRDFNQKIPVSIEILVQQDNNLYKKHSNVLDEDLNVFKLCNIYVELGKIAFCASKNAYNGKEKKFLIGYLKEIEKYVSMNLFYPLKNNFFEEDDIFFCSSASCDLSSPKTTDGYYFANIEDAYARNKKAKDVTITLSEYLNRKPSLKKNIESIQKEFIEKGYEKFLISGYGLEILNRKRTEEYILDSGDLQINNFIQNFINQFTDINLENDAAFIFPESFAPNYFEAMEVCKNAKVLRKINNIFPEEDNVHWLAVFNKSDITNVLLMYHIVYSGVMQDNFGGYKLFGYGLSWYADNLEYNGTVLRSPWLPDYLAHFQGFSTRRDNPYIIFQIRKNIDYLLEKGYFIDELNLYRHLYQVLMPFLNEWYIEISPYDQNNKEIDIKRIRSEIKSSLVEKGIIKTKWVHERTLFELIRKTYPDAIYQYRSSWLKKQSLDIYIPQLSVGIEYQGIQHYQPIDYFGGKEGFEKRLLLDKQKKELCKKNGIKLIEWNYNVEPNKTNLKEILSKV